MLKNDDFSNKIVKYLYIPYVYKKEGSILSFGL